MAGIPRPLRPAVLRLHPGFAVRNLPGRHRPDRRRRLWRTYALRGARAPAAGADPKIDDSTVCDRRSAADQSSGRPARTCGVLKDAFGRQPSNTDSAPIPLKVSAPGAFSVPIESERRLQLFVLTRFLYANRGPLRWKTLYRP